MKRDEQMMNAAEAYAEEIGYKDDNDMCCTLNIFCAGWYAADRCSRWIPVEERRPDERQVVWVRKHFKRKYVGEFDLYDSAAFCNGEFQCDASGNVTHWMPIVPPRKEGEK